MRAYRILFFWEGLLQDSEILESVDLIEAVRHASHRFPHLRAEIWSGEDRLAVIRPSAVMTHMIPGE